MALESLETEPGPVVQMSRRALVVDRVQRAILSGELKPGQRIKEPWLAEVLGVSRPTVRESLQQLIHEGALVQEPHKGVRVASPSVEELRDLAETRVALETLAALRLARDPRSPAMDEVRAALQRHLDAIASGDDVETDLTHLALHRTIWEQAGNSTLTKVWPLVGPQIQVALTFDQAVFRDPERDAELHRRLVRVIEEGDPARIEAEVCEHIQRSVDQLVARLA